MKKRLVLWFDYFRRMRIIHGVTGMSLAPHIWSTAFTGSWNQYTI